MQKVSSLRPFMAALLVALLVSLPLSHAMAGQRQQSLPPSLYLPPEEKQEEGPSTAAKWLGAAFMVGLLYCAWTGCVAGGNAGEGTSRRGREEKQPQQPTHAGPDTSIGCSWGDWLAGTCVR